LKIDHLHDEHEITELPDRKLSHKNGAVDTEDTDKEEKNYQEQYDSTSEPSSCSSESESEQEQQFDQESSEEEEEEEKEEENEEETLTHNTFGMGLWQQPAIQIVFAGERREIDGFLDWDGSNKDSDECPEYQEEVKEFVNYD
jgi:hypothetical protein